MVLRVRPHNPKTFLGGVNAQKRVMQLLPISPHLSHQPDNRTVHGLTRWHLLPAAICIDVGLWSCITFDAQHHLSLYYTLDSSVRTIPPHFMFCICLAPIQSDMSIRMPAVDSLLRNEGLRRGLRHPDIFFEFVVALFPKRYPSSIPDTGLIEKS